MSAYLNPRYRKVASNRPVYYSIFNLFLGPTNRDILLTETSYYCQVYFWVVLKHIFKDVTKHFFPS